MNSPARRDGMKFVSEHDSHVDAFLSMVPHATGLVHMSPESAREIADEIRRLRDGH